MFAERGLVNSGANRRVTNKIPSGRFKIYKLKLVQNNLLSSEIFREGPQEEKPLVSADSNLAGASSFGEISSIRQRRFQG